MNGETPGSGERSLVDIFESMEAASYSLYGKLATFSSSRDPEDLARVAETSTILGERFGEAVDYLLEVDEPPLQRIDMINSLFNAVEHEKRVERFNKIIAPAGLDMHGFSIELTDDTDEFFDESLSEISDHYKEQFEIILASDINEVLRHIATKHNASKWRQNLHRGGKIVGHIGALVTSAAIGGIIANELNKRNSA